MNADVIILINGSLASLNFFKQCKEKLIYAKKMVGRFEGVSTLQKAAKLSMTKSFFLVEQDTVPDLNFIQNISLDEFDHEYLNVWNKLQNGESNAGGVYYVKKDILRVSKEANTLEEIGSGIKYHSEIASYKQIYDVFFISYDEANAEENWSNLLTLCPHAKRIHGVKGIFNAHKAAAEQSASKMFFVVDGDSEIVDGFDFSLEIFDEESKYVHIWKARNPVNGLEYGYGGLKLFCTEMFENMTGEMPLDMSTLIGNGVKLIDHVASITRFDSSPFHTYRGAFRECTKLASKRIKNQIDEETDARLEAWLDNGFGKYGTEAKTGALDGMRFGRAYMNNQAMLAKVNDYEWLYEQYSRTFK